MLITLEQMDQVLVSSMGSLSTVTCAVTLAYLRTTSTADVVLPQVSSKAVKDELLSGYVAYAIIPAGVRSVYICMQDLNAGIVTFPQQPVKINFHTGFIACDKAGGASIGVAGHDSTQEYNVLSGLEIERIDNSDKTPYIVPFRYTVGTRHAGLLGRVSAIQGTVVHLSVRLPLTSMPSVRFPYSESIPSRKNGMRVYNVIVGLGSCGQAVRTVDGIVIPMESKVVDIYVSGVVSWSVSNMTVDGQTPVRLTLGGSRPMLIIRHIEMHSDVTGVTVMVNNLLDLGDVPVSV